MSWAKVWCRWILLGVFFIPLMILFWIDPENGHWLSDLLQVGDDHQDSQSETSSVSESDPA